MNEEFHPLVEALMRTRWPLLMASLFAAHAAAQSAPALADARVVVGRNVRVTLDAGTTPHVEPHLALNPTDARNLVAGVMAIPASGSGPEIRMYASFDGGQSWQRSSLGAAPVREADPWVAFGPNGTAYALHLPGAVSRSTDGGRTWSASTTLPRGRGGGIDYPKMIVDDTRGVFSGRVYVWAMQTARRPSGRRVAAAALFRSSDDARSFADPVHVQPNDFDNQVGALGVLTDGTLLASFHELTVRGEFLRSPRLWVTRSTDGGATFAPPVLVTEGYTADSPHLAVDRSSLASRDRVYLSWTARVSGSTRPYLSASGDGGETWLAATPIPGATPADSSGYRPHHPMVAVNTAGVVGLTWQDPRPALGARCFVLSFVASLDGGQTFTPPVQMAAEPSCNDTSANRIVLEDGSTPLSRRFGDGGDYHGLVALPDGSFQALWADSRTGVYQLWTARVTVK